MDFFSIASLISRSASSRIACFDMFRLSSFDYRRAVYQIHRRGGQGQARIESKRLTPTVSVPRQQQLGW
jgi:hypothetical protein